MSCVFDYLHNLFVAFDQLLNTFCGGDPDLTISARIGFFANLYQWNPAPGKCKKSYWKIHEKMVDWAWKPLDGPRHCWEAYLADPYEDYTSNNCWFFLVLMVLITLPISIVVGILLRLLDLFIDF